MDRNKIISIGSIETIDFLANKRLDDYVLECDSANNLAEITIGEALTLLQEAVDKKVISKNAALIMKLHIAGYDDGEIKRGFRLLGKIVSRDALRKSRSRTKQKLESMAGEELGLFTILHELLNTDK